MDLSFSPVKKYALLTNAGPKRMNQESLLFGSRAIDRYTPAPVKFSGKNDGQYTHNTVYTDDYRTVTEYRWRWEKNLHDFIPSQEQIQNFQKQFHQQLVQEALLSSETLVDTPVSIAYVVSRQPNDNYYTNDQVTGHFIAVCGDKAASFSTQKSGISSFLSAFDPNNSQESMNSILKRSIPGEIVQQPIILRTYHIRQEINVSGRNQKLIQERLNNHDETPLQLPVSTSSDVTGLQAYKADGSVDKDSKVKDLEQQLENMTNMAKELTLVVRDQNKVIGNQEANRHEEASWHHEEKMLLGGIIMSQHKVITSLAAMGLNSPLLMKYALNVLPAILDIGVDKLQDGYVLSDKAEIEEGDDGKLMLIIGGDQGRVETLDLQQFVDKAQELPDEVIVEIEEGNTSTVIDAMVDQKLIDAPLQLPAGKNTDDGND